MASWAKVAAASHQNATVDMIVHTRGLTDRDVQIHRELHGLARYVRGGTEHCQTVSFAELLSLSPFLLTHSTTFTVIVLFPLFITEHSTRVRLCLVSLKRLFPMLVATAMEVVLHKYQWRI